MANCIQNPFFCEDTIDISTVTDTNKFVTSFFFVVTTGAIIIGIYIVLQLDNKTRALLEPRIYEQQPHRINKQHSIILTKHGQCARDIAALDDNQLMKYIGIDGIVFLLFIKSCIKICLLCTGIAVIILIPIYATETSDIQYEKDWIVLISITNLNDDSWRLWFSVMAAYIFTLVSLKILYDDGIYVANIVDKYLSRVHVSHYTVMITNIPKQYQNQSNLYNLLQTIYPHKIKKVYVIKNTKQTTKITKELNLYRKELKKAVEFHKHNGNRQQIIVSYIPQRKHKDAITYYRNKITEAKAELDYLLSHPEYSSTAFVHFNNLVSTSCCVSTQIFSNTLHFKCALAPYPTDLIKNNLYYNSYDNFIYETIINLFILLVILCWLVLVNSSVIFSNIDVVFHYITTQNLQIYLSDNIIGLISGIIPTILIKLWLSLLPILIESVYWKLSVYKDRAKLNLQILNKYYLCLIVMVLLSVVVTQTLSSDAFHVIRVVENIFATLAISLSKTSTLFIQYQMINALILDPLMLFYPIWYHLIDSILGFFRKNRDSVRHEVKQIQFDYIYFYANLSLELIICVTFSVCSPLILFFSFMHFIMSGLILKHLLITYFSSNHMSTGKIGRFVWIQLLQNIVYGLYLPIMTLIGLVILKEAYYQAISLIVLLLFIVQIQNIIHINTKLSSSFKCVSLQTASKVDTESQFKHLFKSEKDQYDCTGTDTQNDKQELMTFEQYYVSSYSNTLS